MTTGSTRRGPRRARPRTGFVAAVAAAVAAVLALAVGCASTVAGTPQAQPGATPASTSVTALTTAGPVTTAPPTTAPPTTQSPTDATTSPSGPTSTTRPPMSGPIFPTVTPKTGVPDDQVGLKKGVPPASLKVQGATGSESDVIATDTLADLFNYYGANFQKDFGTKYSPPKNLVSYDSTDKDGAVCGGSTYQEVNAFYQDSCDTVAWDRGVLLPQMIKEIGVLAPAVVLSHELGHDVQHMLGMPDDTPTILAEQQADCYAGAYWRWVADGNSTYFAFNQTEGIRQMLLSLFQVRDPVGSSGQGEDDHGNGFDRTYAATLGYTSGAVRCSQIDMAEIEQRLQEFPFEGIPKKYGNVEITEEILQGIIDTVDEYFKQTAPGYVPPKLTTFKGKTPPACQGYTQSFPVTYCPPTNTVSYNLADLQRIGTPTAGWESVNGDFSAIVLLVSRYALAAQAAGHSKITGDNAGLRALCYAGTWATWMRTPQGPQGFTLSPNDLDKAIYEIVSSPLAGTDANGASGATLLERVQAFDIGVTHLIPDCFDFYAD